MHSSLVSPGLCAQLACIWEATARKAGNVHRLQDFADVTYLDFLNSAAAIAPVFDSAPTQQVGKTVLQAIQATRQVSSTNTNLGMVLLLAPLAATPEHLTPLSPVLRGEGLGVRGCPGFRVGLSQVLNNLDIEDSKDVFAAIRLAQPGGLGQVADQDVTQAPTVNLLEAMRLAADRDLIAREYITDFATVFEDGLPALQKALNQTGELETAIVLCHLHLLAQHGDSLISRKCGPELTQQAQNQAIIVLASGFPQSEQGRQRFREFDTWLRVDGHRRNPGATADLTAACLFVALREGIIQLPLQYPWTGGF